MRKTVALISLGCAKNLINSEQMLYLLDEAGYALTDEPNGADAVVVNTCGFIDAAKSEAIEAILELGAAKARGRVGRIVVAGCLAQRYKAELMREMPEIDAIVGTGSYGDIVEAVGAETGRTRFLGDIDGSGAETRRIVTSPGPWAYIKIAEGCDNRCAFCTIPEIRGAYRSRAAERIVDEARELAGRGARELILVAQDTTRYGTDIYGARALPALLAELCAIEAVSWIRLHYMYPDAIDDALIDAVASNGKIVKYFDIPIQHINDDILRRMNRRSSGAEIRALISKLRSRVPGAVIRTSLIAGLPGEGEAQFEELCGFLLEYKLERAGVFTYSPEEGTPAADMPRPDFNTANRRARLIEELQSRVMDGYNAGRVGERCTVLIERREGELYAGRSYAESPEVDGEILVQGEGLAIGGFSEVIITSASDGRVIAKPIQTEVVIP
ncbi:MAG: 30S ribosomal protein S12 methylthiotransferase RimO [Oscillospiraceae bacterium]|jgi:ribosomal protein S12 methylthiotransferase|nr:30S ribosomal protein S12 methylthiotransferase RimO [Oscillospiraceae bacterium]